MPAYSPIFRGAVIFVSFGVAEVLASCGQPEVGLSIIEGVAIFVVNKKSLRSIYKFPVHRNNFCPDVVDCEIANSIEFAIISSEIPFKFTETIVVALVEYRESIFAQVNSAEGVAETEQAISEKGAYKDKV